MHNVPIPIPSVASFSSLNGNVTLAFADGSASLALTGLNSANLGGQAISTAVGGAAVNTALNISDISSVAAYSDTEGGNTQIINVSVTDNGAVYDAGSNSVTFQFDLGSYQYTIQNFTNGDVLDVPDSAALTINNTDGGDGVINIQAADAATSSLIQIQLTGIPSSVDGSIYNLESFNAALGANSLG